MGRARMSRWRCRRARRGGANQPTSELSETYRSFATRSGSEQYPRAKSPSGHLLWPSQPIHYDWTEADRRRTSSRACERSWITRVETRVQRRRGSPHIRLQSPNRVPTGSEKVRFLDPTLTLTVDSNRSCFRAAGAPVLPVVATRPVDHPRRVALETARARKWFWRSSGYMRRYRRRSLRNRGICRNICSGGGDVPRTASQAV